jgi:hypothetical protein
MLKINTCVLRLVRLKIHKIRTINPVTILHEFAVCA